MSQESPSLDSGRCADGGHCGLIGLLVYFDPAGLDAWLKVTASRSPASVSGSWWVGLMSFGGFSEITRCAFFLGEYLGL